MTRLAPLVLVLAAGCTATINVQGAPKGAEVYIVKDHMPSADEPPAAFEISGKIPFSAPVSYFSWENYYIYVGADGYEAYVGAAPNEIKIVPAIAGACLFAIPFPWLWAWGPSGDTINVDLHKK